MKLLFTLISCGLFFIMGCSQHVEIAKKSLEVQIEIKDSLSIILYEDDRPKLEGHVIVTIINYTDSMVKLDPVDIHRLRFAEKKTGKAFHVIHDCACFQQYPNKIMPGDTITREWSFWAHDGSPFNPPPEGNYMLSYGIDDYSKNKVDQEITTLFRKDRRKAVELCKQKYFNTKSFKYQSEQIPVNLKLVK